MKKIFVLFGCFTFFFFFFIYNINVNSLKNIRNELNNNEVAITFVENNFIYVSNKINSVIVVFDDFSFKKINKYKLNNEIIPIKNKKLEQYNVIYENDLIKCFKNSISLKNNNSNIMYLKEESLLVVDGIKYSLKNKIISIIFDENSYLVVE